jgi:hypothetical protein
MKYDKKPVFAVMLVFVIMLFLSSCSNNEGQLSSTKNSSPESSTLVSTSSSETSGVIVKSSNGSLSISAPDGWKADNELWAGSDISLSGWGYAVVVLQKPKSDYAAGFTPDDFLTAVHSDSYFSQLLYNMNWKPSSNITIDNLSGVTVQMDAKNQGNRAAMTYLISVVEDTKNFYEIIGWSSSDRGDLDLKYLKDVMDTFQVN